MGTVAHKWAEVLAGIGVRHVFGIPSGPWVEYMEALRTSGVEFVLVSNEASAGFMADVCGRITGIPGACYGTFGPGAHGFRGSGDVDMHGISPVKIIGHLVDPYEKRARKVAFPRPLV